MVGTYEGQTDGNVLFGHIIIFIEKSNFRFMDGISSESSCQFGNDVSE